MTARLLGVSLLIVLSAASCTSASSEGAGTTPRPLRPLRSPEALSTPATTASPGPSPTPAPLPVPGGAEVRAASGVQRGRANAHCWSVFRGGPSQCSSGDEGPPRAPLSVHPGEVVLLVIEAPRPPDEESIRAFQGSRAGFPASQVDPALRTDLTLDLPPGGWDLDLCAAWYGHGEPICWVFRLQVEGGGPAETP